MARGIGVLIGVLLMAAGSVGAWAASPSAALDTLDFADGLYRTAVYAGSGDRLAESAAWRVRARAALDSLTPEAFLDLSWPDRVRFMERSRFEGRPEWARLAARALGTELPPPGSPSRGRAALLLALSHLENDPDPLRVIDPETRVSHLLPGVTPARERALDVLHAGRDAAWRLQDELLYRGHNVALALGRDAEALAWARDLLDLGSPRLGAVRATLARGLVGEGQLDEAAAYLRRTPTEHETSEILHLRAEVEGLLNRPEAAALVLEKLVTKYPTSPRAETAYRERLDLVSRVPLTPQQHNFLLIRLQEGYAFARDSLLARADEDPGPDGAELVFQVASHAYDNKAYAVAESLLTSVLERDLEWPSRATARLYLARTFRNTARLDPMREHYRTLYAESPRDRTVALWELGREEYSQGLWAEAEEAFTAVLAQNPSQTYQEGALMYRGYARLRQDRLSDALSDFEALAKVGGEREDQAAYWRARVLDRLGRPQEAQRIRSAAVATTLPRTYYGTLLRDALDLPKPELDLVRPPLGDFDPPEALFNELDLDPGRLKRFLRGLDFARMGMSHEAAGELADLRGVSLGLDQALALTALTYHIYPFGIGQANRVMTRLPADAPERSAYERLGQPPVYPDEVLPLARARELDPAVLWSIMRQESLYDAYAVSPAGALGLMQIMPETLVRITEERNLEPRPTDRLFLPRLNLSLGIGFFADRLSEFDGAVIPALASYNAGEAKVYEWLELAGGQTGPEFIECIGYPETANYVRRIGWMAWLYPVFYPPTGER